MGGHVRGPFIEYECTGCGTTVAANAFYRDRERLVDLIADLNANPAKRVCAGCARPTPPDQRGETP